MKAPATATVVPRASARGRSQLNYLKSGVGGYPEEVSTIAVQAPPRMRIKLTYTELTCIVASPMLRF